MKYILFVKLICLFVLSLYLSYFTSLVIKGYPWSCWRHHYLKDDLFQNQILLYTFVWSIFRLRIVLSLGLLLQLRIFNQRGQEFFCLRQKRFQWPLITSQLELSPFQNRRLGVIECSCELDLLYNPYLIKSRTLRDQIFLNLLQYFYPNYL